MPFEQWGREKKVFDVLVRVVLELLVSFATFRIRKFGNGDDVVVYFGSVHSYRVSSLW